MTDVDVTLNFRGGGSILSHQPIFSFDNENVFVCWKNSVLEYNTKTGKLIYEYEGFSSRVVGFTYFIHDSQSCLAVCSESGKVIVWRTTTHYKTLEKQLIIKKIQTFKVLPLENSEEIKAFVSYVKKGRVWFTSVDIKKCSSKKYSLNIRLDDKKCFVDMCRDNYFSVAHRNQVYFGRFSDTDDVSKQTIRNSRMFTCIACHPSEEMVLTGDDSGRVVLWRNIFSDNKVQTVYHWHTLPVRTVCFSTAGSYFFSGGEECVLVKWQIENVNEKRFLPRLPAEIETISVSTNNVYVALGTKDNAVRILDNQLDQVTLIQHLVLGKQYECGIIYDPRTKALILNGTHGHLQFYYPHDMSLLYTVDIVGQNRITNERGCIMENTELTRAAISRSGMWLATVEERKDPVYHSEIRLKFWKFDSKAQKFELNTSVEYPHDKSITDVLFQPLNNDDNLRCVTLGRDKKFKIWQLVESTSIYKKGVVWNSFAVGFYKELDCCGLSFSVDGSLMAVGFGPILTTWTPDSCEMKCSLLHLRHKERIQFVKFGYSSQCHLVVSASANQLSVWNLLTLTMIWTVPLKINFLVADPLSTLMAVLTIDRKVFVFSPICSRPIYSNDKLLKNQKDIVAATFVPSKNSNDTGLKWYERSYFYFINTENELFYISSNEINLDTTIDILHEEKSVFSMMLPDTKVNLVKNVEPTRQLFQRDVNQKTVKKFLEAPIHTMAPTRFSCYSMLRSLVVQKDTVS